MCDCNSTKILENSFYICTECGLQTQHFENNDNATHNEELNVCVYSRRKRFASLLDSVLYPSFTAKDTEVYKLLNDYGTINTTLNLVDVMRSLNTKDKRFCSIHLFAMLFCKNYKSIKPPPLEFKRYIMKMFDEILSRHNALNKHKQFFSYPWLLHKLLNMVSETRYNDFIKPIRCKRRRKKYDNMLADLFSGLHPAYTLPSIWDDVRTCDKTSS